MAGLGLDFFGSLLSGGDIGESLINNISGGDPSQIFGAKPKVAPYTDINLGDETGKAIAANLENLPDITSLLSATFGVDFGSLISAGGNAALSLERGQLPQADVEALQRTSAFKALQGGFGGTPMGKALSLRDLGIGTLQGITQGANLAQQMTSLAEGAYSPFTISTGQQAGTTSANNAGTQASKQFQFNIDAAPNPATLGQFQLDQHIGDQFMSFGLGAAGGAIAGAGGGLAAPSSNTTTAPTNYNGYPPPTYGYNFQTAPTWQPVYPGT